MSRFPRPITVLGTLLSLAISVSLGPIGVATTPAVAVGCPSWASSLQTMGTATEPEFSEVSGLVASTDNPGVFWLIEDSFNPPKIWAINSSAQVVGEFTLGTTTTGNATTNIDWEDIAIDRLPGTDLMYVPDFGDNHHNRDGQPGDRPVPVLYRVSEPVVSATGPKVTGTINGVEAFPFRYADESANLLPPQNAENLIVDPITHDVFVVEKDKNFVSGVGRWWVFKMPANPSTTSTNLFARVSYIRRLTAAGDISPDGQFIVMKNYKKGFLWPRNGTVENTLNASPIPPCSFTPVDRAEALAWAPDGLWMMPEGTFPPLHRLPAA